MRIKNSGPYNGDVGLVESVSDNKVWVRIIPRVDLTATTNVGVRKTFFRIP